MPRQIDLSKHSAEELAELQKKLHEAKAERKQEDLRAKKIERQKRADAATRPAPRTRKGPVSTRPSDNAAQALEQMRKSFGSQWQDDPANPSVELIQCEAQHCGRLNIYHEGKWTSRRLGNDAVVAIVKLADGTQETRKFERDILNAEWRRS